MTDIKAYETLTLGQLIAALKALPEDAVVLGLGTEIHSYRGYYERNAIEPDLPNHEARYLADQYQRQIGQPIYGYKGGEWRISDSENVYLASYGDTGPNICGLVPSGEPHVWEPLLVEVNEW